MILSISFFKIWLFAERAFVLQPKLVSCDDISVARSLVYSKEITGAA